MRHQGTQRRAVAPSWLFGVLALVAVVLIAATAAGCERNSQLVADEQIRESQNPCPKGCEMPVPGCVIKGKVAPTGEKRFVTPNNRFYPALPIDPATGERWFCTEEEAIDSGFSRSRDN